MVKTATEVSKAVFDVARREGDLQGVMPLLTLKKIAQEARAKDDLDQDAVLDAMKRFQQGTFENLAKVSCYVDDEQQKCFRMILTSKG